MTTRKRTDDGTVIYDPVDTYEERPYKDAVRSPEETAAAEGRVGGDQIEDYHKENPTLSQDDLPDDEVILDLQSRAAKKTEKQAVEEADLDALATPTE